MNVKKKLKELEGRLESLEKVLFGVLRMISNTLRKDHEAFSELENRVEDLECSGKF